MRNQVFARNVPPLLLWLCLTAFSALATFYFSSQNREASSSLSMGILSWLLSRFPFLSAHFPLGQLHNFIRKLAHFTLYFILGCGLSGLYTYQDRVPRTPAVIATAALYAALDEFHQHFILGRGPQLSDVLLDTCGAACGCGAVSLFFLILERRNRVRRK